MNFKDYYKNKRSLFEEHLKQSFPEIPRQVSTLEHAMKYSLFAGGKRIRPILLLVTIESTGMDCKIGLPYAAALEYIHTYSLIHDDLPCMDDDDLRRGLPTNHIKFGEDIALLAGDALLTHSFALLSSDHVLKNISYEVAIKIITLVSTQAGIYGMVTGQVADISKIQGVPPYEALSFTHKNKTGALIKTAIQIGALLGGVDENTYQGLTIFGEEIGKCFQIQDDILDEIGYKESLGKQPGSDLKNQKLTYPSVFGIDQSRKLALDSYEKAIQALHKSGLKVTRLEELAEYILKRIQ